MTTKQHYYGTGRRKSSIARVFLCRGKGKIIINCQPIEEYFGRETSKMIVRQPFVVTNLLDKFDAKVTVKGGGDNGQAGAIRLGVARALTDYDRQTSAKDTTEEAATSIHKLLRHAGLLTRDAREVERKKVGRHKARRGTQYSKR